MGDMADTKCPIGSKFRTVNNNPNQPANANERRINRWPSAAGRQMSVSRSSHQTPLSDLVIDLMPESHVLLRDEAPLETPGDKPFFIPVDSWSRGG